MADEAKKTRNTDGRESERPAAEERVTPLPRVTVLVVPLAQPRPSVATRTQPVPVLAEPQPTDLA